MKIPALEHGTLTSSLTFGAATNDFRARVASRFAGVEIVGGQTINALLDDGMWSLANAYGPHQGDNFAGYNVGGPPVPLRATASALSITGATYEGSDERALINNDTSFSFTFGVLNDDTGGTVVWAWKITDAATGDSVRSGTLPFAPTGDAGAAPLLSVAVNGGLPPGSYLLWVWIQEAARPYAWPPPDYATVSGQNTTTPLNYAWKHPVLGTVYYDPVYNVGAYPYDATQPDQAALLNRRASLLASGGARKNPAWVSDIFSFHSDGTPVAQSGEYGCLKIVSGASTAWIGDGNCHINSTPGIALWKKSAGVLTPWMLEPRLRSAGAFYIEGDVLYVGGMLAGRNGRTVGLFQVTPDTSGSISDSDYGTTLLAYHGCECAQNFSESVTGIVRVPNAPGGQLVLTTFCETWLEDRSQPPASRLAGTSPGGRSLILVENAQGNQTLMRATEDDFVSNAYPRAFDRVVLGLPGHETSTRGTAHHYDSVLAAFGGAVWAVEEDTGPGNLLPREQSLAQQASNTQYLVRASGSNWVRAAGWSKSLRDMGRVGATDVLLVFGQEPGTAFPCAPTVSRFNGALLQHDIGFDYFPERIEPVVSSDGARQNVMMVAKKVANGVVQDGDYIIETTGHAPTVLFEWNSDTNSFCALISTLNAAGYQTSDLPAYLIWTGSCWQASSVAPTDGSTYLALNVGGTTACYILHGALPYDVTQWDAIALNDDGLNPGTDCWPRVSSVTNARDAYLRMPAGTTIQVIKVKFAAGDLQGRCSAARVGEATATTLRDMARLYPCLWLRADGSPPVPNEIGNPATPTTAMLDALATFTQRAGYQRAMWLPKPARAEVLACVLIAPNFRDLQPTARAEA